MNEFSQSIAKKNFHTNFTFWRRLLLHRRDEFSAKWNSTTDLTIYIFVFIKFTLGGGWACSRNRSNALSIIPRQEAIYKPLLLFIPFRIPNFKSFPTLLKRVVTTWCESTHVPYHFQKIIKALSTLLSLRHPHLQILSYAVTGDLPSRGLPSWNM